MRIPAAALLLAVLVGATLPAQAKPPPIAAVEAVSKVSRQGRDMKALVQDTVQRNLRAVKWGAEGNSGPYVLSSALVRMDTTTSSGTTKVSCTVSMVLRDQKGGTVRAMVEGRGRAEDKGPAVQATENDALDAAVQGAVRSLPEAIRRIR